MSDHSKPVPTFENGDRVILLHPEQWIDKKLQLRSAKRIPGTVVSISGTALRPVQRSYRVIFDAVGRIRSTSEIISALDLELVRKPTELSPGDRVCIVGWHPWTGHCGSLGLLEILPSASEKMWHVKLDDGECY